MTQAELFKALRGESRTEVDLSLGQVPISPTIQSGGKYTVVVPPVSRQNSATRLSAVLAQVPQVTGQFKNIQQQAGVREANELTPDEVIRRFQDGDVEAQGFLASFGKEKTFQEQLYSRYFTSTLQPGFTKVESEMRNLTPRQISEIGDVRSYVQQKLVDSIDPDVFNTIKDPNNRFMAQRHNLAMEALIPKVVESVVGSAERKKQDYALKQSSQSVIDELSDTGVPQRVPEGEDISVTVEGLRSTAFGSREIDPTTAEEIDSGKMARVGGDEKRGSSGMLYRGLEADIPTVAIHKSHGLKGKDYIKVTSDLFPEGKIFQVAGTGPAPGRLDFYSSNKEEYNNFAAQKLQSVVKVDKDGKPLAVKAPSNIARMVEASSSRLAAQGIGNDQIIAATYKGLSARANSYIANGDLENARELLEFLETGDIKVEGKSFIKTATGRTLATEMLKSIEAEEDKIDREESKILGEESDINENDLTSQIGEVTRTLRDGPLDQNQQEGALVVVNGIGDNALQLLRENKIDAAAYNRIGNLLSEVENDIKNGTMKQNSRLAAEINAFESANSSIIQPIVESFSETTDQALGDVKNILGADFISSNSTTSYASGVGRTTYSEQLKSTLKVAAGYARNETARVMLRKGIKADDPNFNSLYETEFANNFKAGLQQQKDALDAQVDSNIDSPPNVSEQVLKVLKERGLAPTSENIATVQEELLKDSSRNSLLDKDYNFNPESLKFLSGQRHLNSLNNLVDNDVLFDRANLDPSVMAQIATVGARKAVSPSYFSNISKTLGNTSDPLKRLQIRQNYIQAHVRFTGLPVDVLEGSMVVTKMLSGSTESYGVLSGGGSSYKFPFTLDFDAADNYFKRYNERIISSEAVVAYDKGNTSLMDRAFAAGVAKGQLNEGQRQDFIDEQLRIGRDIGIIKPLSQNNEQE